jgi:predicted GH43/DUF377 family glycosyl hydrolase
MQGRPPGHSGFPLFAFSIVLTAVLLLAPPLSIGPEVGRIVVQEPPAAPPAIPVDEPAVPETLPEAEPPAAAAARPERPAEDLSGDSFPWSRHGIVLDRGEKGDFDDKNLESPIIVRDEHDVYVMFYRGQSSNDCIGRIMQAVSLDGRDWIKTGVVMEPREPYEGKKIDPMAVFYEDGIYKMYYGCAARGGSACLATSRDGFEWERHPDNPVLTKTTRSWDNRGAGGQHTVIKQDGRYTMLYKGYGSEAPGWTFYGVAESEDGVHWTKLGKAVSPNPRIGETTTFKNLFAFQAQDDYYLAHTMADYLNLYFLHSRDGERWEKCGLGFEKARTPGGWDVKWATSPFLSFEEGVVRMWYEGGDRKGRVRVLYAEIEADDLRRSCPQGDLFASSELQ